jgi:hypothetical protein
MEKVCGFNKVVRGQHNHHRVPIAPAAESRSQSHGSRCVPPQRLPDHILSRQHWQLHSHQRDQSFIGQDQYTVIGHETGQTVIALLKQAPVAKQAKELFGLVGCAERPESRSRATGHDHDYKIRLF